MAKALFTITSVAPLGGNVYRIGIADSSLVTVLDHVGTVIAGPASAIYRVTNIPDATHLDVSDILTEANGGSPYGTPVAAEVAWYATPRTSGGKDFSDPPRSAVGWDAFNNRNEFLHGGMATQEANAVAITGGDITGITDLAIADGGTGSSNAADARTALGLDSMATQDASAVAITGGSIVGITDLAIADGGTGASDATNARANLGLDSMATQPSTGVGITGGSIVGITDLAVADGGTGGSTAAAARTGLELDNSATILAATITNIQTTTGPTTLAVGAVADGEVLVRSGATIISQAAGGGGGAGAETLQGGRLSISSTDPEAQGGTNNMYLLPYVHDKIGLWDGADWTEYTFDSTNPPTLSEGGLSIDLPIDVFVQVDTGLDLEFTTVDWTNASTRATGLTRTDGVRHLTGDQAQRYLGTVVRSNQTSGIADQDSGRFVWREHYRFSRHGSKVPNIGAYTLVGAVAVRPLFNSATLSRMDFVLGDTASIRAIFSNFISAAVPATTNPTFGWGFDSTVAFYTPTANISPIMPLALGGIEHCQLADDTVPAGLHTIYALETQAGAAPGTTNISAAQGFCAIELSGEW